MTVTAAEINTLDGITAVLSELNALDLGSTAVGTAVASKAVILDSNKDYTGIRNFTITGELDAATLDISGDIDVDGTTNLDVVDIDGAVDFASTTAHAGNASFADNAKAIFGAGSDLQIYHDGSHSYIQEAGTGNLRILAENFTVRNPSNNESMIIAAPDGAVTLFHDSSARLATTSTGVSVTGAITGTSATFTTADNESQLTLKSTDADADVGPVLDLTRDSGSPADGDAIGRIRYRFDNDNGDEETAIFLDGTLTDASDGTEDASFKIQTKVAGTARNRIDITSSEVVFNEDSVDLDFRVESNGSTKKFFVDGGENVVCINTDSPRGIASTSNRQFQMEGTSGISSSFSIARNQNSTGGPGLFFGKTRGTEFGAVTIVQDGDSLGSIGFAAADGTDVAHQAASIAAEVDGTPGANDVPGRIVFKTTPDGSTTLNERMRINAQGDLLFNTTVDYGGTINIARGTNDEVAYFVSTDADSSTGPVVTLLRASASPADNDVAGRLSFSAYNSAGADTRFGKIQLVLTDVTDGTEDGRLEFEVMEDGAERSGMTLGASGAVFNEDSRGEFDFRVESNGKQHMLFVDAGTDSVRIGSSSTVSTAATTLQVTADSGERAADVYRPTSTGTGVIFAAFSDVGGTATKVFEVEANGDVENATNSYSTISDQRLKQDIVDANSQWNDIKSLQIRNFRFINDVNQNGEDALRHIGVVAQEVESAGMTGLVKTRNDEDTGEEIKSVKSSIIYMKAVKALQEAITRIETLEAEVTALKGGS